MDGVLEGAVVLCVCKLTCSLLFLPSLAASYSPVSFCCCCLLIFTDFLVAVFLSFLSIFESWLTELNPPGDVIALRFLLFLSHTYGTVLLLTTFLILLETLIRVLWPHVAVHYRTAGRTDGRRCYIGDGTVKEVEGGGGSSDTDSSLPQVVGFFCCLSVWFIVALNVRWHWRTEEAWAAVCLHTTDSLVRCLPSLLSSMPSALSPYWIVAFLFLLLVLLIISTSLQRHQAAEQMQTSNGEEQYDCCWQSLIPASAASLRPVHPGMLVHHHGDSVLTSTHCLLEKRGEQEQGRTKRGVPVSFISGGHVESQHMSWSQLWGFPGPEDNLILAFLSVLSVFTLPFNLSVNILLIRTIDYLLDCCIRSLLSSSGNTQDTSITLGVTQV